MKIYDQSYNSHMLCFDPVIRNKTQPGIPGGGNPFVGGIMPKIIKNIPGVRGLEGGGVRITYYAPKAERVHMEIPGVEMGWFWQGRLNYIIDNLLAESKCEEMIVVANAGYAYLDLGNDEFEIMSPEDVIVRDCVPFIDNKYRTMAYREYRAIAGLSMGGGQARHIAHTNTDVFANLGVFSSGAGFLVKGEAQGVIFDYSELFKSPENHNSVMKVTFVGCGTEDMRHEYTSKHVEELSSQGYNVEYHPYPGGHEWNVWRLCASDFAMELFR